MAMNALEQLKRRFSSFETFIGAQKEVAGVGRISSSKKRKSKKKDKPAFPLSRPPRLAYSSPVNKPIRLAIIWNHLQQSNPIAGHRKNISFHRCLRRSPPMAHKPIQCHFCGQSFAFYQAHLEHLHVSECGFRQRQVNQPQLNAPATYQDCHGPCHQYYPPPRNYCAGHGCNVPTPPQPPPVQNWRQGYYWQPPPQHRHQPYPPPCRYQPPSVYEGFDNNSHEWQPAPVNQEPLTRCFDQNNFHQFAGPQNVRIPEEVLLSGHETEIEEEQERPNSDEDVIRAAAECVARDSGMMAVFPPTNFEEDSGSGFLKESSEDPVLSASAQILFPEVSSTAANGGGNPANLGEAGGTLLESETHEPAMTEHDLVIMNAVCMESQESLNRVENDESIRHRRRYRPPVLRPSAAAGPGRRRCPHKLISSSSSSSPITETEINRDRASLESARSKAKHLLANLLGLKSGLETDLKERGVRIEEVLEKLLCRLKEKPVTEDYNCSLECRDLERKIDTAAVGWKQFEQKVTERKIRVLTANLGKLLNICLPAEKISLFGWEETEEILSFLNTAAT